MECMSWNERPAGYGKAFPFCSYPSLELDVPRAQPYQWLEASWMPWPTEGGWQPWGFSTPQEEVYDMKPDPRSLHLHPDTPSTLAAPNTPPSSCVDSTIWPKVAAPTSPSGEGGGDMAPAWGPETAAHPSSPPQDPRGQDCVVCGEKANGHYFGALVCLPCKSFFIRCTKDGAPVFTSQCEGNCNVSKASRVRCQYCRFQRCLVAGMSRKEKPESVEPGEGQILCKVCGDIANGIHFGVNTCEGCKKFFRRGLQENQSYTCKGSQRCQINPRNRNNCRLCRYKKCIDIGMSREAIKMGRPKKNDDGQERCRKVSCLKEERGAGASCRVRCSSTSSAPYTTPGTRSPPDSHATPMDVAQDSSCSSGEYSPVHASCGMLGSEQDYFQGVDSKESIKALIAGMNVSSHGGTSPDTPIPIFRPDTVSPDARHDAPGMLGTSSRLQSQQQTSSLSPPTSYQQAWPGTHSHPPVSGYFGTSELANSSRGMSQGHGQGQQGNGYESLPSHDNLDNNDLQDVLNGPGVVLSSAFTQDEVDDLLNIFEEISPASSPTTPSITPTSSCSGPSFFPPSMSSYPPQQQQQSISLSTSMMSHPAGPTLQGYQLPGASPTEPSPQYSGSVCDQRGSCMEEGRTLTLIGERGSRENFPSGRKPGTGTRANRIHQINAIFLSFSDCCVSGLDKRGCHRQDEAGCSHATSTPQLLGTLQPLPCTPSPFAPNSQAPVSSSPWSCQEGRPGVQEAASWPSELSSLRDKTLEEEAYSPTRALAYWRRPFSPRSLVEMTSRLQALTQRVLHAYVTLVTQTEEVTRMPQPLQSKSLAMSGVLARMKQRTLKISYEMSEFASKIPGTHNFHPEDRHLLCSTASFCCRILLASLDWTDPLETQERSSHPQLSPENPLYLFRNNLERLAEQVKALTLDRVELALLCALQVTCADFTRLHAREVIEESRTLLLEALFLHESGKCRDPAGRLQTLLALMPKVRHAGLWHKQIMKCMRVDVDLFQACSNPSGPTFHSMDVC